LDHTTISWHKWHVLPCQVLLRLNVSVQVLFYPRHITFRNSSAN